MIKMAWSSRLLKSMPGDATLCCVKVLSIEDAQTRLDAVCEEALSGQVIRIRVSNGALLELMPIPAAPHAGALRAQQVQQCYEDTDWAAFENGCAKASD